MSDEEKTPPQTPNGFITETVKAVLSQLEKPKKSFIQQILDVWPLILIGVSLVAALISLSFATKQHMANPTIHFAPDGDGAKDSFARTDLVSFEIKAEEEKLDKKLEIQSLKQELQLRKTLSEFKDNYAAFKKNTAKIEDSLEAQ